MPDGENPAEPIAYAAADLIDLGVWPRTPRKRRRYGGVLFDTRGRLLLREPTNHFGGYVWTFPKGRPDDGESPDRTARREVLEETGYTARIIGHVPGYFSTGPGGSANYFYLMRPVDDAGPDEATVLANGETAAVRWVTPEEAPGLISLTPNRGGRARDLAVLEAAVRAHSLPIPPASPPPPR